MFFLNYSLSSLIGSLSSFLSNPSAWLLDCNLQRIKALLYNLYTLFVYISPIFSNITCCNYNYLPTWSSISACNLIFNLCLHFTSKCWGSLLLVLLLTEDFVTNKTMTLDNTVPWNEFFSPLRKTHLSSFKAYTHSNLLKRLWSVPWSSILSLNAWLYCFC
jgi:hypothetical protein